MREREGEETGRGEGGSGGGKGVDREGRSEEIRNPAEVGPLTRSHSSSIISSHDIAMLLGSGKFSELNVITSRDILEINWTDNKRFARSCYLDFDIFVSADSIRFVFLRCCVALYKRYRRPSEIWKGCGW